MDRKRTQFVGVYKRESSTRRHHGRPDVCYDVTYKGADGRKVWAKAGWASEGWTAAAARDMRNRRLREMRHPDAPDPTAPTLTLGEAWDAYRPTLKPPARSRVHTDVSRFNVHLAHLRNRPLSTITAQELQALAADMLAHGLSAQTARHVLGLVRRIYRKMITWGRWTGRVPTAKVDWPQADNRRDRWLRPIEARMLLDEICCRSRQWHHIALTSLHTGARASEIFGLTGDRVHLDVGELAVRDTKTDADRVLYMTSTLRRVYAGLDLRPGVPVFASRAGGPIIEVSETITRAVRDLGLNAGVTDRRDRVVFYTLRHTYASWLAMAGLPLYHLARLMGHSDEQTTQRYAHLCPGRLRQSADLVEQSTWQVTRHAPPAPGASPAIDPRLVVDTG